MKTPQEIINALPEGNRKRACILLMPATGGTLSAFWAYMECKEYGLAASLLEDFTQPQSSGKVLADMIWEG